MSDFRYGMLKPNGKILQIKEQILIDPVSGLKIRFSVGESGECKITLCHESFQHGNRDLYFMNGEPSGAGCALSEVTFEEYLSDTTIDDILNVLPPEDV